MRSGIGATAGQAWLCVAAKVHVGGEFRKLLCQDIWNGGGGGGGGGGSWQMMGGQLGVLASAEIFIMTDVKTMMTDVSSRSDG